MKDEELKYPIAKENKFTYKGTEFHRLQKGLVVMGGDVEGGGKNSHSAYGERFIEEENFIIPHTQRGTISMASVGVRKTGSQFYICLNKDPNTYLDGR